MAKHWHWSLQIITFCHQLLFSLKIEKIKLLKKKAIFIIKMSKVNLPAFSAIICDTTFYKFLKYSNFKRPFLEISSLKSPTIAKTNHEILNSVLVKLDLIFVSWPYFWWLNYFVWRNFECCHSMYYTSLVLGVIL